MEIKELEKHINKCDDKREMELPKFSFFEIMSRGTTILSYHDAYFWNEH